MTASSGRIYFWHGGSLWLGEGSGRTQWHAHHAHQLAVALAGSFRFRTEADGAWTSYEGAIVPSHCTHQFELDGATMAHLFVEPESLAGRALARRYGKDGVADLPRAEARQAADRLREVLRADPPPESPVAAARGAISLLSGATTELDTTQLDPRLARALQHIRTHIRNPLTLSQAAAAAALSGSRFRHLFVAQTGCSFRAYVLWLRINLAIESVMAGASWTDAAHEAGFADSAHLTRTHKRMFGIEPTAVRPLPSGAVG